MKVYTIVAEFPSKSRPGKSYTVKRDENGDLSCDCREWTKKKTGQPRTCIHVRRVDPTNIRFILDVEVPKVPKPKVTRRFTL